MKDLLGKLERDYRNLEEDRDWWMAQCQFWSQQCQLLSKLYAPQTRKSVFDEIDA